MPKFEEEDIIEAIAKNQFRRKLLLLGKGKKKSGESD